MKQFMNGLMRRFSKRSAQSLVEYTLVLALVALFCIGALKLLGSNASAAITSIASVL